MSRDKLKLMPQGMFSVDEDRLSGAPDFSFLNHAPTAADRIVARDLVNLPLQ